MRCHCHGMIGRRGRGGSRRQAWPPRAIDRPCRVLCVFSARPPCFSRCPAAVLPVASLSSLRWHSIILEVEDIGVTSRGPSKAETRMRAPSTSEQRDCSLQITPKFEGCLHRHRHRMTGRPFSLNSSRRRRSPRLRCAVGREDLLSGTSVVRDAQDQPEVRASLIARLLSVVVQPHARFSYDPPSCASTGSGVAAVEHRTARAQASAMHLFLTLLTPSPEKIAAELVSVLVMQLLLS